MRPSTRGTGAWLTLLLTGAFSLGCGRGGSPSLDGGGDARPLGDAAGDAVADAAAETSDVAPADANDDGDRAIDAAADLDDADACADAARDAQDGPTARDADDAGDAGDAADACASSACVRLDATTDVQAASDTAPQSDAASTLLAVPDVVSVLEGGWTATGNVLMNDRIPAISVPVLSVTYGTNTFLVPTSGLVTLTPSSGGTLTVHATGAFTYRPPDSVSHSYGPLAEVVTYTVTDQNGISTSATLTINISDTAPVAYLDSATVHAGGVAVQGNVITGVGPSSFHADILGRDMTELATVTCGSTQVSVPGTGQVVVVTEHSAHLVMAASGDIVYNPPASVPAEVNDVCTYTLSDSDGSTSSASLTVTVTP